MNIGNVLVGIQLIKSGSIVRLGEKNLGLNCMLRMVDSVHAVVKVDESFYPLIILVVAEITRDEHTVGQYSSILG